MTKMEECPVGKAVRRSTLIGLSYAAAIAFVLTGIIGGWLWLLT